MIKVDQIMEIRDLHRQGHAIRDIARITGHSRNTIRKALRGEEGAAGTGLAAGPPHRSQRAALPHWAPTSGGGERPEADRS